MDDVLENSGTVQSASTHGALGLRGFDPIGFEPIEWIEPPKLRITPDRGGYAAGLGSRSGAARSGRRAPAWAVAGAKPTQH